MELDNLMGKDENLCLDYILWEFNVSCFIPILVSHRSTKYVRSCDLGIWKILPKHIELILIMHSITLRDNVFNNLVCEFCQKIKKELQVSSKDQERAAIFIKRSQNDCKFCHKIVKWMHILSKDRETANFAKETREKKSANFIKRSLKTNICKLLCKIIFKFNILIPLNIEIYVKVLTVLKVLKCLQFFKRNF